MDEDEVKEAKKKWKKENPDYDKKYYQEHKDIINIKNKKWREENKEKFRLYQKKWEKKNREKKIESSRK